MPGSKPSRTQSIALWRAHDEICVYCNKPIESLAVLEIDHIIPQKLLQTPNEERKLRRHALSRNALTPLIHLIEVGHLSKQEAISCIEEAIPDSAIRRKS